jgi:predicted nuclease with TOPRIM domain
MSTELLNVAGTSRAAIQQIVRDCLEDYLMGDAIITAGKEITEAILCEYPDVWQYLLETQRERDRITDERDRIRREKEEIFRRLDASKKQIIELLEDNKILEEKLRRKR